MATNRTIKRFIYKTAGVCPPEIYLQIDKGVLAEVRFVGGGCPGNARLVTRLLQGKPVEEVLALVKGIECRNGTSCPDQLSSAIEGALDGRITPAASFVLAEDPVVKSRIALFGPVAGDRDLLERVARAISGAGVRDMICIGNLTGRSIQDARTVQTARKLKVQALQGPNEWNLGDGAQTALAAALDQPARDWLAQLPQVLIFHMGGKKCMAFFGDFVQKLPEFSDYEPYALEINVVCGLTDFMQDETVFPALEAMAPQFAADAVLFGQANRWGHWQLGGKDFISIGPAGGPSESSWGLLEVDDGKLKFTRRTT